MKLHLKNLFIGKASMTSMMSADSGDENSSNERANDDLYDAMVSLWPRLGQKVAGLKDDALHDEFEFEQAPYRLIKT